MSGNKEFFYRRLHSLLGVIPVGLFLVQHLVINHF
ncbi:MAG: succinate dehydrogenase, partial [Bacillus sp. (in: Bacteria)]|nr:succinate dehydrogenase [Bacillus sp. (in: firmicutes)]